MTSEQDKIAAVLTDWLAEHGYPVAGQGTLTMVSLQWLRGELIKIKAGNPSRGNSVPTRRWNKALDEVSRVLDDFERRQTPPSVSVRTGEQDDHGERERDHET